MAELLQTIFLVIGFLAGQAAHAGNDCPVGPCPEIPHRPVVAWTAPQSLPAGEIRLWSRGERRPGQPGATVTLSSEPRARLVVAPAAERLLVLRVRAPRR